MEKEGQNNPSGNTKCCGPKMKNQRSLSRRTQNRQGPRPTPTIGNEEEIFLYFYVQIIALLYSIILAQNID